MSDFFGIGNAVRGCIATYFNCSRHTGRTTSLVDSLETGDRVIFVCHKEAERVRRMCLERDVEIEVVVRKPKNFDIHRLGTSQKRTILDHTFVEQYHQESIEQSIRNIEYIQQELSGYEAVHRETRRKAIERSKFITNN